MAGWLIAVIAVVVVIAVVAITIIAWWISTWNKLKRMKVKIGEAYSGIDVALEKRYDLLTKQVDTVKGYSKHEFETLQAVIQARNQKGQNSPEALSQLNGQLDRLAAELNVVVEQYPDLKASQNFLALQNSITDCEEHLQASRRIFNSNVSLYNQKIATWPSSIVAHRMKATPEGFFQADERKREDVKIQF